MGRETALLFAAEGGSVVIAERDEETAARTAAEVKETGAEALAVQVDVSRAADVERLCAETLSAYGHIDVLVNNAGVFSVSTPLIELSEEEWDRMFAVNTRGVFLVSKAIGKHMAEQRSGAIVNFSSISSFVGTWGTVAYCASKAAVNMITRILAIELAPFGIRVNAVAPGFIETDINREQIADPAVRDGFLRYIPAGRFGVPADVARVVAFLASPEANYMNGSIVTVDAGWTAQYPNPAPYPAHVLEAAGAARAEE
jgi:NAD(P)-dependent dehydrogenase (short-subunit alcohol dehydrogenase family)